MQVIKILTQNEKFWLYINNITNLGASRFSKLYFAFDGINDFDLDSIDFLSDEVKAEILTGTWINKCEEHLAYMANNNIGVIFYKSKEYPVSLKNIPSPPPILYFIGDVKLLELPALSIVGSRKPTSYGRDCVKIFTKELVENNICIVSGMAEGIDAYAHNFTLNALGNTIAVLGGGVDYIYPPSNRELYQKLKQNGLIISEYPLSVRPQKQYFPERNRIISGLASTVLIIEAKLKSGTMSTVDHALEQNKTVFAVPGNITSVNSEGTNALIKAGASIACSPSDVLEEFGVFKIKKTSGPKGSNELENKIIDLLMLENRDADFITQNVEASVSDINTALMMLEISGIIERLPGNEFTINK